MMVEVRELVWVEASSRVFDAAAYGMGLYRVKREEGGWTAFKYGDTFRADCSTLDEAKAAAQADFEYRILSALSPADRPMEVSAMRELPRDLVTILRAEAKNQRTPPIDYVIAEDGGRMVHRPEPDIAMAELLEEAARALAAKDAELAAMKVKCQALDDECQQSMLDIARERDRAERAEAQLAEANKALEPFAEDYEKHSRLSEDV